MTVKENSNVIPNDSLLSIKQVKESSNKQSIPNDSIRKVKVLSNKQ